MAEEMKWFMPNGEGLWRSWVVDYAEIETRAVVKKSRKDCTCVLGCKLPAGSS
jgi:hypothetical protein